MTTMIDMLQSGEVVNAILQPLVELLGMQLTLFILLAMFLMVLYAKIMKFYIPLMMLILLVGGIQLSSLFAAEAHPIIPQAFDSYLFVMAAGGLAFLLFLAAVKKSS